MLVLSGKEPWWSLIAFGEKRLETRGWRPNVRPPFPLALHTSATMGGAEREICRDVFFLDALVRHGVTFTPRRQKRRGLPTFDPVGLFPPGHIIAVCRVDSVARLTGPELPPLDAIHLHLTVPGWSKEQELAFGNYAEGRYAWLLSDVQILPNPIPAKGALGLWQYDTDAIEEALRGSM